MRPLIRTTLEAGFEIIGWVIFWHPIQVLVFAPVSIRVRLAALRTLAALNVVIREAQGWRASQSAPARDPVALRPYATAAAKLVQGRWRGPNVHGYPALARSYPSAKSLRM